MRNYKEHIAKETFYILLIGFTGVIFGYILKIYLARSLGVAEFGLLFSVIGFLYLFTAFKDVGLSHAIPNMVPEFLVKKEFDKLKSLLRFSVALQTLIGIAIGATLFMLSDWISTEFFHNAGASIIIKIFSVEFFISFPALKALLHGTQKVRIHTAIEPVRILLIFIFLFLQNTTSPASIAISYVAAAIMINMFLVVYGARVYNRLCRNRPSTDVRKKLMVFGLSVFAGSLAGMALGSIDTILITYFISVNEVALYHVALSTSHTLLAVSSAIGVVLLPSISEIWNSNRKELLDRGISIVIKYMFMLIVPLSAILIAFPEIFLNTIFGAQYIQASNILRILAVSVVFISVYSVMLTLLYGIGQPKTATKIIVTTAMINLVANVALINIVGVAGAAVALIVSYLYAVLATYSSARKYVKLYTNMLDIVKIFVGGAVSITFIMLVKFILKTDPIYEIVLSVVAGFVAYAAFLLATGVIRKDDVKILEEINMKVPKFLIRLLYGVVEK